MRNRILVATALLALCFTLSTQVAQAQQAMIVDVPFAFVAGHATLPAGEYRVESLNEGSAVTLIRSGDQKDAAMVITFETQANGPSTQSKLVFNRYGSRYFLSNLWIEGSARGRQLPRPSREKELVIAKAETPTQITLVASLAGPKH